MSKRALLIGINYIGTPNQLQGCIYDVIEMKSLLVDAYGFDPNTIITLRDDDPANRPTRARILQEIQALVANATPSTNIFLHYSGHGTQITDTTGTEIDGLDECIVPCDYATANFITDQQINNLVKGLKGVGIAIFDTCRSGTIMDLPFTGIGQGSPIEGFYCFSGCQDNQDAQEDITNTTGSNTGLPQGAMTMAFISTVRSLNYYPTISNLYTAILANLQQGGYSQVPQLTSSVSTGPNTPFPFSSPNQQLSEQQVLNAALQTQITALQAQVQTLEPQAAQVPSLEAQVQSLSVIQEQYTALLATTATNTSTINTLQAQVQTIPALQAQAALVPQLQNQVAIIPGLQNQMSAMMSQLVSQTAYQKQILQLQNQNAVLEYNMGLLDAEIAALKEELAKK